LAVLSHRARPLHHFFKQRFAQVTNPPIDPIRENIVFSLCVNIGKQRSFLEDSAWHAAMIRLESPLLDPWDSRWIKSLDRPSFTHAKVSTVFNAEDADGETLRNAIDTMCAEAERQIDQGATILILSDYD